MLFGLASAPATFQAMMDKVLKGLDETEVHYLDDVIYTPREHWRNTLKLWKKY